MIDFNIMDKTLKVAWIDVPRLQSRSDASWKIIPEAALECHFFHNATTTSSSCNITSSQASIATT